jgi:hypothetical protein
MGGKLKAHTNAIAVILPLDFFPSRTANHERFKLGNFSVPKLILYKLIAWKRLLAFDLVAEVVDLKEWTRCSRIWSAKLLSGRNAEELGLPDDLAIFFTKLK